MDFSEKARRRREIFEDFDFKIIDFMKKIDENQLQIPKIFSAPSAPTPTKTRGGGINLVGGNKPSN